MQTPEQESAANMDKVMLLALWTKHFQGRRPNDRFRTCGMGKPAFPMNEVMAETQYKYWQQMYRAAQTARKKLDKLTPGRETRNWIANRKDAVVGYGHPQGEPEARALVARALNRWYSIDTLQANDVLYTAGGAGAINIMFNVIHKHAPDSCILTPMPYYSLYGSTKNRLLPFSVMDSAGYHFTAHALETAIDKAKADDETISALIFSNPCNPTGVSIPEDELLKIADVLRKHPEIIIISDGAYEEMYHDAKHHPSLLTVAPDLSDRIMAFRSATKAASAAGERMAIAVTTNPKLMGYLVEENIRCTGHAPISSQHAFAKALCALAFDKKELKRLCEHYAPQVDYMFELANNMGAEMPDPNYKPDSAFYVMCDLSDLLGTEMPEGYEAIFGNDHPGIALTDEDIAYSLLLADNVMICPLSYYGVDPKLGFIRITCSGGDDELQEVAEVLEARLLQARKDKQASLLAKIEAILKILSKHGCADPFKKRLTVILQKQLVDGDIISAKQLKLGNQALQRLSSDISLHVEKIRNNWREKLLRPVMTLLNNTSTVQTIRSLSQRGDTGWQDLVAKHLLDEKTRKRFLMSIEPRHTNGPTLRKNPEEALPLHQQHIKYKKPILTAIL